MPILLKTLWEKGWDKNHFHKPDDPIFVVTFIDEKSGKTLFKYGAKLTDINFWIKYFTELGEYEHQKLQSSEAICPNSQIRETNNMERINNACDKKIC